MPDLLHDVAISAAMDEFRKHKGYAEGAFAQLRDDDFFHRLNPRQCSISAYIHHVVGNMRSRFTDFLTSDGEKSTRNREDEFAERVIPRSELMEIWEQGWATVFDAIESLREGDLLKTVYVRREPHSVQLAITRQVAHYAYHVGQIVLLAKHVKTGRGEAWGYMTIPPGESQAFNQSMGL